MEEITKTTVNTNKRTKTVPVTDLVYMAIGTVIIVVCSWISIPAAVPFTLQTFAVFLVTALLGGKEGIVSVILYILLGAVGVPVFSGMTGGFIKLVGVTGGYIIGFIFIGLIYWMAQVLAKRRSAAETTQPGSVQSKTSGQSMINSRKEKSSHLRIKKYAFSAIVLLTGLVVCYAFGTAWFMVAYAGSSGPIGLGTALSMCVLPFILPDLAKLAAAVLLADRLKRILHIR